MRDTLMPIAQILKESGDYESAANVAREWGGMELLEEPLGMGLSAGQGKYVTTARTHISSINLSQPHTHTYTREGTKEATKTSFLHTLLELCRRRGGLCTGLQRTLALLFCRS